jgi:dolichol-phosphate mannosyltransferase
MAKLVSIVAPAFDEATGLARFLEALKAALAPLDRFRFEVLVVDDGSRDGTADVMAKECARDPRVHYVRLARNFGQQAALAAGLEEARGDCVVTLDADLQHPPELIADMLARWEKGCDVVDTHRRPSRAAPFMKELLSRGFYRVLGRLTGLPLADGAADFRLLDRQVVDVLRRLPETRRFYRGLIPWLGFRRETIDYTAGERVAGRTKYSLSKMLRLASDGIFGFTNLPLRVALVVGALAILVAVAYTIYALYVSLVLKTVVPGWTSLLIMLSFFSGVNLFVVGILGEYIGRIYDQVKGRPPFVVDRRQSIRSAEAERDEPRS